VYIESRKLVANRAIYIGDYTPTHFGAISQERSQALG